MQDRRGAALIIALVLLAFLGIIAGTVLPRIYQDRQESRKELLRIQSRQLLDDAFRNAEVKRQADSDFSGETFSLGTDQQPFAYTFLVTTRCQDDNVSATVECRNKEGITIYSIHR